MIKIVDENNATSEIPFRESKFYIKRNEETVDTSKLKIELWNKFMKHSYLVKA